MSHTDVVDFESRAWHGQELKGPVNVQGQAPNQNILRGAD